MSNYKDAPDFWSDASVIIFDFERKSSREFSHDCSIFPTKKEFTLHRTIFSAKYFHFGIDFANVTGRKNL